MADPPRTPVLLAFTPFLAKPTMQGRASPSFLQCPESPAADSTANAHFQLRGT